MADGPDDPKQKADKAWRWCERQWDRAPSPSQMVEAAVTASIEAALAEALAPVLERVARLEELAQFPTLMAENDALLQKMADAPCATCGGARWVCDVSVDGASYHRSRCPECSKPAASPEGTLQHNPGLGSVTMSTEQAAALLKSSKPAAGPEGERAPNEACSYCIDDTQIGSTHSGAWTWSAAGMCGTESTEAGAKNMVLYARRKRHQHHVSQSPQPPSPAEPEGKPDWADWMATNEYHQSLGAKWMCEAIVSKYAPDEREFVHAFARKWEDASFWRPKTSAVDVCPSPIRQRKYRASCRHIEELAREDEEKRARLEAAERRIAELESALSQSNAVGLAALANARAESGPQAPERVTLKRSWSVNLWQSTNDGFGTEYVRADVHAKGCVDSRRLGEEYVRILDERGDFTEGSRPWRCEKELEKARTALASAERRIAELEGANAAMQVDLADFTNAAFANGRAEGREAGLREAVAAVERTYSHKPYSTNQTFHVDAILALLANKPEVGT